MANYPLAEDRGPDEFYRQLVAWALGVARVRKGIPMVRILL